MTDAVERIVNLALYLASTRGPVTAEQVRTEVFGYPKDQDDAAFIRMFERDKEDLRHMGFAIHSEENAYRLDVSQTFAAAIDLTPTELAAVRVASTAVLDDPAFPFSEELCLALAKLSAEAQSERPAASSRMADEDPGRQGSTVSLLAEAAAAHKSVTFGYTNSLGQSAPHKVEPYGLFLHDGRWYLVGRDTALGEVRTYTVARMADIAANTVRPKSPDFEMPEDFDVSTYARLPFQYGPPEAEFTAVIEIDAQAAWRARALAGGQGTLDEMDDGRREWRVAARSVPRLLRFVVENGPGLRLVGPPEVSAELRDGLERTVALHG